MVNLYLDYFKNGKFTLTNWSQTLKLAYWEKIPWGFPTDEG